MSKRPENLPDLTVCILFFEKVDQTLECIESFLPSTLPILVCNNGSSKNTTKILQEKIRSHNQVTYIETPRNLGVSGGRNTLIRAVETQFLFFVDNDITVKTSSWVNRFQAFLRKHPDGEVFIPELYNVFERTFTPHGNLEIENGEIFFGRKTKNQVLNMFPGGASIINKSLFERLGLYDENFFVNFEDYELCLRGVISESPVRAYEMKDILLRHDHRQVVSDSDRRYVEVRYDPVLTQSSAQQISEKYHLKLRNDASSWSVDQMNNLINGRSWRSWRALFYLIPASWKKWWNS